MLQLWGSLIILIFCPLLGAIPLISWITQVFKGRKSSSMGAHASVSTAFYLGGTLAGILAVLSEAFKGIAAVLIARAFFGAGSPWELVALIFLVIGRYAFGKAAGTTNVAWGFALHNPLAAAFGFLLTAIAFTFLRDRKLAKFGVLFLFPIIVAVLRFDSPATVIAAIVLAGLLGWIYKQIPDNLELELYEEKAAEEEIPLAYKYVRDRKQPILTLNENLDAALVGDKAACLSEIMSWGYPVPKGWVLTPLDDPQRLIDYLQPSELSPLVVRSSAIGEDSEKASGAGLYLTVLNVTTKEGLRTAIARVQASYDHPTPVQYRHDMGLKNEAIAVLLQQQIGSVFSGVAFSRDPMSQDSDAVIIEATSVRMTEVTSTKVPLSQYRAFVVDTENYALVQLEGSGNIPPGIVKQVAILARRLEERFHGVPQDIEWSYDGQTLWILQSRPISTLLPIWARKIAIEVVPGVIHPLSWSINRPLICGVWGGVFAVALGARALGLDFSDGATLHFSRAYCNATLLGQIFRRIGLPAESLEFFTKGDKFDRPTLDTALRNLPGLTRLILREFTLEKDFGRDYHRRFIPGLSQLAQELVDDLPVSRVISRIEFILDLLRSATYYNVVVPLSVSARKSWFKVKDREIDNTLAPDLAAVIALGDLAKKAKEILIQAGSENIDLENIFEDLAVSGKGLEIIAQFNKLLERYAYLSEAVGDIALPTWKEEPQKIRQMFVQLMQEESSTPNPRKKRRKKKRRLVQNRVNLKAKVSEVYARLLAELRWSFIALEGQFLNSAKLTQPGDIFFLELEEVRRLAETDDFNLIVQMQQTAQLRRWQFSRDSQLNQVPPLVYGNTPPISERGLLLLPFDSDQVLQGIPTSHGVAEGRIKVLRNQQAMPKVDKETILVMPYTDSAWAPLLMNAGGLITESGGKLSHTAILAREYGIPAITNVNSASWLLQDGQWVRIDGTRGIIEISNDLRPE